MWISCAAYIQFKEPGILNVSTASSRTSPEHAAASEENMKQGIDRLQKMMEGTIQTIINMLEIRDPYTAGHQRGVRDSACAIAAEMGLSDEAVGWIQIAALIHDIGKVSSPRKSYANLASSPKSNST